MVWRSTRTGFVYKTDNPILVEMYNANEDMVVVEEPKAEMPEAPKTKRSKKTQEA